MTNLQASAATRARYLAVAGLLLNAAAWGISWVPFRWLQTRGLQSLWTTALIYLVAALLIAALYAMRRPRAANGRSAAGAAGTAAPGDGSSGVVAPGAADGTPRRLVRDLLWLALASGLTNACFNWAMTIGSVVRVVLLFYLMPIWSALLARWLLGEAITAGVLLRIVLAMSGAAIVLWRPELGLPLPQSLPDWLAIAGGMTFALTNVMLRRLADAGSMARAQAMFTGSCAIPGALALLLATLQVLDWPSADVGRWLPGALGVALIFIAANLALQFGAARLPAAVTAIVMISEVVFATGSALLFGDERLSLPLLVGGALVLLSAWSAARAPAPGPATA